MTSWGFDGVQSSGFLDKVLQLPTMFRHCLCAGRSQFTNSQGQFPLKRFFNFDVASVLELSEMGGQIPLGQICFTLQKEKICAFHSRQNRNDQQASRLMDQSIQLGYPVQFTLQLSLLRIGRTGVLAEIGTKNNERGDYHRYSHHVKKQAQSI